MPSTRQAEPRAHHYVPKCWLAGFTDTGDQDGRLWVADLGRARQWPSSPVKSGHSRDFNRISDPNLDPLYVEDFYSKIEGRIAPVFKALDRERRSPRPDELKSLCFFMALQWSRVPAFRPKMLGIAYRTHRATIARVLSSRASWNKLLKKNEDSA